MKSFADWTDEIRALASPAESQLPEGVFEGAEAGEYLARCVSCGEYTPLYCDFKDFDESYHYCGGSPRCCP